MDHQNTIPSMLGPVSGREPSPARQHTTPAQGGGLLKVVSWVAAGMLALAVVRHFLR